MAARELAIIDREIAGLQRQQEDVLQEVQDTVEVRRALEDEASASLATASESRTAIQQHEGAARTAEEIAGQLRTQEIGCARLYCQMQERAGDLDRTLVEQREIMDRTHAEFTLAQDAADQVWTEWLAIEERRATEEAQASSRTEQATESRTQVRTSELNSVWLEAEVEALRRQAEDLQRNVEARAEALQILAQVRAPQEMAAAADAARTHAVATLRTVTLASSSSGTSGPPQQPPREAASQGPQRAQGQTMYGRMNNTRVTHQSQTGQNPAQWFAHDDQDAIARTFQANPGAARDGDDISGLTGGGRGYMADRKQGQDGQDCDNTKDGHPPLPRNRLEDRVVIIKGVDVNLDADTAKEFAEKGGGLSAMTWIRGRKERKDQDGRGTGVWVCWGRNMLFAEYQRQDMLTDRCQATADVHALGLHGMRLGRRIIEVYRANKERKDHWADRPKERTTPCGRGQLRKNGGTHQPMGSQGQSRPFAPGPPVCP